MRNPAETMIRCSTCASKWLPAAAFLAAALSGEAARAQDNADADEAIETGEAHVVRRVPVDRRVLQREAYIASLNRWIKGRFPDGVEPADQLEARLARRVDDVWVACRLDEAQLRKLTVAGRGDIKHFMNRLDEVAKEFTAPELDLARIRNARAELKQLDNALTAGLFSEGSLFAKVLGNILSETNLPRYQAMVRKEIGRLGRALNMSSPQCEKLSTLVLNETRPPLRFGRSEFEFVMYQASRVPEVKLRPLFTERQWTVLFVQLKSSAESDAVLRHEGFALDDRPVSGRAAVSERSMGPAFSPR
jgi:hypothetical protein